MLTKIIQTGIRSSELETLHKVTIDKVKTNGLLDMGLAAQNPSVDPKLVIVEADATMAELEAATRQWFQPQSRKLQVALERFKLEKIRDEVKQQREAIARKLHSIEIDLQRIKLSYPWHQLWVPVMAIVCVTAVDAATNYKALQILVPNLLISIIVAILTVATLGLAAHAIGGKVREARSPKIKWLWFGAGMLGGAALFFLLGLIRQAFYGTGDSWLGIPFLWTIWNSLFFGVAIFLSARYLPTRTQWNERTLWSNLKKELADLLVDDKQAAAIIEQAEQEQVTTLQELAALQAYETDIINRLDKQRELITAILMKEYYFKGGQFNTTYSITHSKQS